ncbi:MAG: peptidoglycan DD-metalloendopeptidase family protein [Pseudanabaenaceae cyanobacterium]|jgi:murein DD-endopeptidase MepM/ murein hydrolase activator NlpD
MTKVPLAFVPPTSHPKVRRSLAVFGLAVSVGTVGVLLTQHMASQQKIAPVAISPRTLTDVMAQNQERKYEMARTSLASGSWDSPQGVVVHEVRENETLWNLTQIYQVDAAAIAASNNINANTELQAGTKLFIPPVNGVVHKVKQGDTLDAIANYYNVPKTEIVKYTALNSGDFLAIDQPLVIPGNVTTLMQVKDTHVKRELFAERERLAQRLQELEGKKSQQTATQPVATLASDRGNGTSTNAVNNGAKPTKFTTYNVQTGDTIETIARRYGITQRAIIEANKLENPHWLELNQALQIPLDTNAMPLQTVSANLNLRPEKRVPAPVVGNAGAENSANEKRNSGLNPVEGIRVSAATPMVLPGKPLFAQPTNAINSPWSGLLRLTGADLVQNVPLEPAKDQPLAVNSRPVTANNLPVATEINSTDPTLKVVAALFPFAPESLIEQATNSGSAITPTNPAPKANGQQSPTGAKPTVVAANSGAQGAAPQIQPPIQAGTQWESPAPTSVKIAAAQAPNTPPTITEQVSGTPEAKADTTQPQPANEPAVKPPTRLAAASAPNTPATLREDAVGAANAAGNPKVALAVESESRISTLEVKQLEAEINQLNTKVQEAEAREAARRAELARAEAARTAAATAAANNASTSVPSADRNFDAAKQAVVNNGDRSGLAPEAPTLTATAYLPDANEYGIMTGFIWPAEGVFTSGFGWRWGRIHQGIDIAAPIGTPILAAAGGVVEYAGWSDGGYGNMVDLRHPDGTITRYGHMNAILVKDGQTVAQGQTIGEMGSTGFSTGPHLHFEIRPNGGSAIDPMVFLAKAQR